MARAFERAVQLLAPFDAEVARAPGLDPFWPRTASVPSLRRCIQDTPARFDIAVTENDMRVRIPVGLALFIELQMQRKMPRHAVLRHVPAKVLDRLDALLRRQLARQRADEAVGHPRVFAFVLLLLVEPGGGLLRGGGDHMATDRVDGFLAGVVGGILRGAASLPELGQVGFNFVLGPLRAMVLQMQGVGREKCAVCVFVRSEL